MKHDLNAAWGLVECLLSRDKDTGLPSDEDVADAVSVLKEHDVFEIVAEWFVEIFRRDLYSRIVPVFWSHFNTPVSKNRVVPHVCQAFQQLHDDLHIYSPCFDRLGQLQRLAAASSDLDDAEKAIKDTEEHAKLLLKAIGFTNATQPFQEAMLELYSTAFKAFDAATPEPAADESGDDDLLCCAGCDEDRDACTCAQTIKAFHTLNTQLSELGLLERLSDEPVSEIIHQRIQLHIERTCKGNFEQPYIAPLEQWLESKVVGWLELLYGQSQASAANSPTCQEMTSELPPKPSPITAHKGRLYHFLYTVYATTRISELFAVIIEFPDSQPALRDLKACLEKTDLRSHLVTSLRTALETRLLHPGVNTSDILTAYISAIRALRVLDPSGVLLELVCQPVRTYLRCREDTVRCIVSSLTEDSSSELSDELVKGEPLVLNESYHGEDETEDWQNWVPDPVDADPVKMVLSRRSSDIISMLVNIYGSKELFVNEYRTLLADRILTHFNYDTEKEIRYLELLKLRFGESQLHYCEVMLKDVADSKRINAHIQDRRLKRQQEKKSQEGENQENKKVEVEEEPLQHVNAMILSAEFWPTFREEKLELPEVFQKSLDVYTKSFEALKGNRTLNWKNHLGLVNLELELKDRKMELNVSPVHATIIWHYQQKAQWSVEELSSTMMMPTASIRRKMALWQSHGLLREESPDVFVLVEEAKGKGDEVVTVEEDEAESAMASASDQRAEEMQVVWSYIVGMLTNLESLPLERIHSMLKMFAMQGPSSECSLSELKDFLDRKVKEQKLSYSTGVYRLPKPGT